MSDTPKSALSLQLLSLVARLPTDVGKELLNELIAIAEGVSRQEHALLMLDEIVDAARQNERTKYAALQDLARTRMNAKARARR